MNLQTELINLECPLVESIENIIICFAIALLQRKFMQRYEK